MTRPLPNKTILRVFLAGVAVLLFCGAAVGVAGAATTVTTAGQLTTAVANDFDVILGADITLSDTLTIGKIGTIDLGGHMLTRTGNGSVISVTSTGNLTLKDTNGGSDPADTPHYFTFVNNNPWKYEGTT